MLSVISNYPGIVHFVYTDGTGVMLRPIVTDLRHQAEILGHGRWRDLSVDVINIAVSLSVIVCRFIFYNVPELAWSLDFRLITWSNLQVNTEIHATPVFISWVFPIIVLRLRGCTTYTKGLASSKNCLPYTSTTFQVNKLVFSMKSWLMICRSKKCKSIYPPTNFLCSFIVKYTPPLHTYMNISTPFFHFHSTETYVKDKHVNILFGALLLFCMILGQPFWHAIWLWLWAKKACYK